MKFNVKAVTKQMGVLILVAIIIVAAVGVTVYYMWPKPAEVTSLRILSMDYDFAPSFESEVPTMYKEYTDDKVEVVVEMYPFASFTEKVSIELSGGSSYYDIMVVDIGATGDVVAKEWVMCLEEMNEEYASLDDIDWDAYQYPLTYVDGRKWSLPITHSAPGMLCRQDLFDEYNVSIPTNWDEFLEAAEKLTLDLDEDGEIDVYGLVMHLAVGSESWNEYIYRMIGMGPQVEGLEGWLFDDDFYPVFNTPDGLAALNRLIEQLPYAPPGVYEFSYGDTSTLYYEGKVAMYLDWMDIPTQTEDPTVSQVVGKTSFHTLPHDDSVAWNMVSGYQLFVNKYSENPEEAYKFLAWMSNTPDVYRALVAPEGTSINPPIKELIFDPEVKAAIPAMVFWDEVEAQKSYPFHIPFGLEQWQIIGEEVNFAAKGLKTPEEAMDAMEQRLLEARATALGE